MSKWKTLYLVAKNHMDPTWLRAFVRHYDSREKDGIVRGYSDLEELQILEYMDFAEQYGVKYEIEQSAVVKRFLERNPDQKERFASLVKKGLLELAGGGECVIDYNLPRGESWARAHLYSIKYYERTFGMRPRYAICPDIFGLPAQLPQFMRSVGYDAIILFDRVLLNNKPYWKGLDGTLIVLDSKFLNSQELRTADCVKILPCPVCKGRGCPVCGGTGLDPTYDMTRPDKVTERQSYYGNISADELLESLHEKDAVLGIDRDEYYTMITTEETRVGDYLFGPLVEAAKRHNFNIKYLTFEENHDRWLPGQVAKLRAGDVQPDEIELRQEGNPVFCGCYTSLISIKRQNRELESLLDTAERLSALAFIRGGWRKDATPRRDYPAEKLEKLWNGMSFVQFHDAITGTHCNESHAELQQRLREIRRGATQICDDAMKELLRDAAPKGPKDTTPVVCFNPNTATSDFAELYFFMPADVQHVEILDAQGGVLPSFDERRVEMRVGASFRVTVHANVPALGCRTFFARAAAETPVERVPLSVLENEYYRLEADGAQIVSVFDKRLNRNILTEGAGGLVVSRYVGSVYRRAEAESRVRCLAADSIATERTQESASWILKGSYADPTLDADSLVWEERVTLRRGEKLIRFQLSYDWQGRTSQLCARFPMAIDADDKLMCEVPFGQLARGALTPVDENVPQDDMWPSLDYAGVTGEGASVAVFKKGLYGTRFNDGTLRIGLMNSVANTPDFSVHAECGHHECEFAISSWAGDFSTGAAARTAAQYTAAQICAAPSAAGEARLPENLPLCPALNALPETLRLSALKRSEDGKDIVLRFYETSGQSPVLALPGIPLVRCNTLEEPQGQPIESYAFHGFEIATFRVPAEALARA